VSKKAVLPCLIFRTEPLPLHSTISDVVVTGNVFRNQHTHGKCTVRFVTRPEALSCVYESINLSGNVFDGDVQIYDVRTSGKTTIRDIVFADNICEGALLSEPIETMASSHIVVRGNMLRQAGNMMLKASNWIWNSNTHVNGTLEVAPSAKANIIRENVTAAPVTDKGTDNVLTGNVVMKKAHLP
jgi:WD40 repeat protein